MLLATLLLTLTAQTAWAAGDIYVGYLDPTAPIGMQRKTVLNPVWVDDNTVEIGTDGKTTWYFVSGTITKNTRIEVKGTVNLILADGCNFTVSKGIHVPSSSALNIYAQSVANRGSLTANNNALPNNYAAIGGNGGEDAWGATAKKGENAGDITIYGGNITITNGNIGGGDGGNGNAWTDIYFDEEGREYSNDFAGNGGNGGDGNVTIYSGYVWVKSGNIGGGKAGTGEDSVSGDSGVDGNNGDGTVNLSWANTSDRIYADYYYGSVTLQKAFYNIEEAYIIDAGVVNNNDLLNRKNLIYAGDSYTVTIGSLPDGVTATADLELSAGVKTAVVGQVVTISFSGVPDGKVPVVSVTYGNNNDNVNDIIDNGDGTFSFVMPNGTVTVTATVERSATIDLSDANGDFNAIEGDVLTGTTSHTVTIADGAGITLSGATISGGIVCEGTATITLVGTNSVSGATNTAGIQIGGSGTTLTINGDGTLTANGGTDAAGIGLNRAWNVTEDVVGGNIVINGGTITANGGGGGAGIGAGVTKYENNAARTATVGNITIAGGSVTAVGGSNADGIGAGQNNYNATIQIGTVTIYDAIEMVDASSIKDFASVVYMHGETNVTASKTDYFTIGENGDRRIIVPKDDTDYTITIADGIEHGTLSVAAATAKYMQTVTVTATPAFGYRFVRLIVKDAQNNDVAFTGNSFFMPKSNVTVSAEFEQGVHGTTEFKWTYFTDPGSPDQVEETIYDGVTTVNIQQIGKPYNILKYEEHNYYTFLLDNSTYDADIPYAGGTGEFYESSNPTNFYIPDNGQTGYYDITLTDVGNGKWGVSILPTAAQMDVVPDQTYTGSAITPEPLVIAGSLSLTKGTDYVYSYTNNTNVGTATVRATFQGDYASLGYVEKTFTIGKGTPTITAPTPIENLVYTGSAQALVTAGSADFGTLLYSLEENGTYSADIPTATDAGDYTVYYKVEASDNWNAVDAASVAVTIAPRTYTISFDANGGTGTMEPMQLTYDSDWATLTANTFTREGYGFKGWNTEADGTGTDYSDEDLVRNLTDEADGNVVLYAQWGEDIASCEIRGTLEAYDDGYGPYNQLAANVEVWDGDTQLTLDTDYTIELDPNIDIYSYVVGEQYQATVKGTGDWSGTKAFTFTFVALHHTVVFVANGGSGTMASGTVANDGGNAGRYTLPVCGFTAPDGKVFDHWVVDYAGIEENPIKQPGDYFTAPYIYNVSDVQTITVTAYWRDALILLDDDSNQPVGSKNADIIAANDGTTELTVKAARSTRTASGTRCACRSR